VEPPGPQIVRILTRLNVGGPARQAIILNRLVEQHGFRSLLVTGRERAAEGQLRPDSNHLELSTLKRAIDPLADGRSLRSLTRIIRARRPAVVHTHMAKAGLLGRVAARRARVPVIVHTFHGHVLRGYFPETASRVFRTLEQRLARWTDALIAVSPAVRDELLGMGIGTPSQWRVIPIGLDLEPLMSLPPAEEARARLGLPETGPVVGSVGRLVSIKDHDTFLQAAARISDSRPDVTFVVAGDGERRAELAAKARTLLGDRVRFVGWISHLPTLYGAMDVVVLTSRSEGTPAALIEAGAAGRPVVATSVGGVGEVVEDDVTGYVVPPADPSGVAERVERLLADQRLAAEMGGAGRDRVVARFSAERLAGDLADLYSELLNRKR
jgi:glycosyltransferase involved in cell wall biosynthesis